MSKRQALFLFLPFLGVAAYIPKSFVRAGSGGTGVVCAWKRELL